MSFIGRLVNIYIARETSRGVGIKATYALPKSTFSLFLKPINALSTMSYGSIGETNQSLVALRSSKGGITFDMGDTAFGLFLYAAFGTYSVSGPTDTVVYTHTFSLLNSNQHPTLSIHQTDSNGSKQFVSAMVNTLEIKVDPAKLVTATVDFVSKEPRTSADQGAAPYNIAYAALDKFLGRHVVVKLATNTAGLAAATALQLKNFSIKIAKNVYEDFVLGTIGPKDIVNMKFEITGDLELNYADESYQTIVQAGTYKALRLQMINTDVTLGATSNPTFILDLSRVFLDAWTPAYPNDALSTQKLTFRAMYDITNANIVNSCTLKNIITTY